MLVITSFNFCPSYLSHQLFTLCHNRRSPPSPSLSRTLTHPTQQDKSPVSQDPPSLKGFPGDSVVKNWPASAGDREFDPGSERLPGEIPSPGVPSGAVGSPLQCPGSRGAWQAKSMESEESDMT